jgi:nucleoside-diphosphate-sugar epimerase/uncharacterized membrane protein
MLPSARDTVVVTGATGFLGSAIVRRLAHRYRVIALDRRMPTCPVPGVEALTVDLADDASVADAVAEASRLAGGRFASVIHLAAYYDVTGEENPLYDQVTVQGTRRLRAALRGLECEQFVYASTLLVHAPGRRGEPIDEDWPLDPAWPYPRSKLDTERLIEREGDAIPTVTMRFAGVYDEDCRAAFIAQQIARIYEKLPTAWLFAGDIDAAQPYVHVDDLVDSVERAVERRAALAARTTLLIGEATGPSYRELQETLGRLMHGERWRTIVLPKRITQVGAWFQNEVLDQDTFVRAWMIENSATHYELDTSRARRLLGWEPRSRLIDTVPEMVRRLKADPPAWYAKNGLSPSLVAASAPELEKARERLAGPLERPPEAVREELHLQLDATLWAPLVNAALGLWLMVSPAAYGLFDGGAAPLAPALGHDLPPAAVRDAWLGWSEIVTGALIVLFSLVGLNRERRWAQWIVAALGCWLLFAPLVFWTSSPAAYAVDTLLGMLVVAFAVIVPPPPGVRLRSLAADDDRPLGWSYSPSTWTQRLPIVALSLVGLFVSRYLAAYQLGHVDELWDPFFAAAPLDKSGAYPGATGGSESVVTSWLSKAFPIPDAGLGAAVYALDILAGAIGDRRRWRTMPWMVLLFGFLIIPLGAVSLTFVLVQPTLIGTLCTLCIVQAIVTLVLIPYSVDEVLATCQYLRRATRAGEPFWKTFWHGGPSLSEDQQPAPDLGRPPRAVLLDFLQGGVNFPWTLVAVCALALALSASPVLLGTQAPLYWSDHVAGWVALAIAITALAEIARAVRFLNVPVGLWIAVSPFVLDGGTAAGTLATCAIGLGIAALSLPRGRRSEETYGAWDRAIV